MDHRDLELEMNYRRNDGMYRARAAMTPGTGVEREPFLPGPQQAILNRWYAIHPQATALKICAVIKELERKGT